MNVTKLPERNLDILRALAVLFVVADHSLRLVTDSVGPLTMWALGRMGVLLFFVHTSLVLMSSLERQGQDSGWVREFYTRRAFRIYPLSIAAVLAWVAFRIPDHVGRLSAPVVQFIPVTPRVLADNLLLIQNLAGDRRIINVLWTLPIEVQMYALLPACFVIARRFRATGIALLFGVAVVGWAAVDVLAIPELWRFNVLEFSGCFVCGVMTYAILRSRPTKRFGALAVPLAIMVAGIVFISIAPGDSTPERGWPFCFIVACIIPFAREAEESVVTRTAKVVAKYSYGIYLTHVAALWVGFVVLRNRPIAVQLGAATCLIVLLPWVAYQTIEAPGITLGKRVAKAPPRQVVPEVGAP